MTWDFSLGFQLGSLAGVALSIVLVQLGRWLDTRR